MPWFVKYPFFDATGPMSSEQLKQLGAVGSIEGSTLVAKDINGPWVPASSIKGLVINPPKQSPKQNESLDDGCQLQSPGADRSAVQGGMKTSSAANKKWTREGSFVHRARQLVRPVFYACSLATLGALLFDRFGPVWDVREGIIGVWRNTEDLSESPLNEFVTFVRNGNLGASVYNGPFIITCKFLKPREMQWRYDEGPWANVKVVSCTKYRLRLEIEDPDEGGRVDAVGFARVATASGMSAYIAELEKLAEVNDMGERQSAANRKLIRSHLGNAAYFESLRDKDAELSLVREAMPKALAETRNSRARAAADAVAELQQKRKSASSFDDIERDPAFKKWSYALAASNEEAAQQFYLIETNYKLSQIEREARVENIRLAYGSQSARQVFDSAQEATAAQEAAASQVKVAAEQAARNASEPREESLKKVAHHCANAVNKHRQKLAEITNAPNVNDLYDALYAEVYVLLDAGTKGLAGDAFAKKMQEVSQQWLYKEMLGN
jgi:hypothetical protein